MKYCRLLAAVALPIFLLVGCSKKPVRRETILGRETMNVIMPQGEIAHPVHGKETWFAYGAMNGVAPAKANGAAQAHAFADGFSSATVTVNIQEAPKGSRYVAWLRKPGSSERIRLDILQNPLRDVRHAVTVEIEKDLREFTEMIVTQERASGPSDDDAIVANGTLKLRQR